MEIKRDYYLNQLKKSVGNGMVKVITGPRRCGKSYLLFRLWKDFLLSSGADPSHIIGLSLDDITNIAYRDPFSLSKYLKDRKPSDSKTCYFLLDEIQFVEPVPNPYLPQQKVTFYDLLNELLHMEQVEVFVTGSNSKLLSSDIATEFRGRGWVIPVHPLSFSEFLSTKEDRSDLFRLWEEYWKYGGLPACTLLGDAESKIAYLRSTFQTVYIRDIVERYHLQGDEALKDLVRVLASSAGSPMSYRKIADTFASTGTRGVSPALIKRDCLFLEDAFLVSRAENEVLKGRKCINAPAKYYFEDLGLRYAAADFSATDQERHYMENVIYNEMKARGYTVKTGKLNVNLRENGKQQNRQYEVDFVCSKSDEKIYIQSAFSLPGEEKLSQEKRPLLMVNDSFRKVLISKYFTGSGFDEDGILRLGLFDFLTQPDLL